ncbi:MAG: UbiA family prenyltransferase [Polyangiaceae bacterium]
MTLAARARELLSIVRYHITLVAMMAVIVFSFLLTGRYNLWLPLLVGADWFLINMTNRVTDIDEDQKNGIAGTAWVARQKNAFLALCILVFASTLTLTYLFARPLFWLHILVQAIGFAYNYRLVPTPSGLRRFKELYFFKNFMSACLFVLTCIVYPLALAHYELKVPFAALLCFVVFFLAFEITYEILYDLRDVVGDRDEKIPTYPVVHGELAARRIIDTLLVLAIIPMTVAFAFRWVGVRELLLIAAPIIQFAFYRPRYNRGLTPRDCIHITHLGSALLVFYLVGTWAWNRAGLPENIYVERVADENLVATK